MRIIEGLTVKDLPRRLDVDRAPRSDWVELTVYSGEKPNTVRVPIDRLRAALDEIDPPQ
jgi:hypothetical protein